MQWNTNGSIENALKKRESVFSNDLFVDFDDSRFRPKLSEIASVHDFLVFHEAFTTTQELFSSKVSDVIVLFFLTSKQQQ